MKTPSEIIDALGRTAKVAEICVVTMPSVSDWRIEGIPKAPLTYIKVIRSDVFEESPAETAPKQEA